MVIVLSVKNKSLALSEKTLRIAKVSHGESSVYTIIIAMIVYFTQCETCKDSAVKHVKQIALVLRKEYPSVDLDERYVLALPQWKEEATKVGARLPFMFSPKLRQFLELEESGQEQEIEQFLRKELDD